MKIIIILTILLANIYAITRKNVEISLKNSQFQEACLNGSKILSWHKNDEIFVNKIANACLKVNFIDMLAPSIRYLRNSKKARKQSIYYATILLQKRLLYHAIIDDVSIEGIRLPKIDYILSVVVDNLAAKKFKKIQDTYVIINKDKEYKIKKVVQNNQIKVEIKEYKDNELLKTIYFW